LAEAERLDYPNVSYIARQSQKDKFTISDLDIEDGENWFPRQTMLGDES